MLSAFIDDGYTEHGYVKEFPRLHPECRFTFRPMTIASRATMIQQVNMIKDPAQQERVAVNALADKLLAWSLPLPITAENVAKLKWRLFDSLASIVLYGTIGGDEDPLNPTDAEHLKAMAHTNPGDELMQAREKNCAAV